MPRIVANTPEEGKQWAKALLAAAGPERKLEVRTDPERGAFIAFEVPDDIYEAAVAAGQPDVAGEAAGDATTAEVAAKKAAKAVKAAAAKKEPEKGSETPPPPPALSTSAGAPDAPPASPDGGQGGGDTKPDAPTS